MHAQSTSSTRILFERNGSDRSVLQSDVAKATTRARTLPVRTELDDVSYKLCWERSETGIEHRRSEESDSMAFVRSDPQAAFSCSRRVFEDRLQ